MCISEKVYHSCKIWPRKHLYPNLIPIFWLILSNSVYSQQGVVNKGTQRAQTSAKAAHYLHIALIPSLGSQVNDPYHPQNLFNCFLYNCRAILKISLNSTYNLLGNVHISNLTVSMVIQMISINK